MHGPTAWRYRARGWADNPFKLVALGFLLTVAVIAVLLALPVSAVRDVRTTPMDAVFTAAGATSGTLANVDTGRHWSPFGHVVIMVAMQVGGLGFMTSASMLGMLVSRRLGVRMELLAAAETRSVGIGDARRIVREAALIALVVETATTVVLFVDLWLVHHTRPPRAAFESAFHSVAAFNNGGYSMYSDSLTGFARDPLVLLVIAVSSLIGAVGFPVLYELRRELRTPRRWSLHTRLTLLGMLIPVVGGSLVVTLLEWDNPRTLGSLGDGYRPVGGFFSAIASTASGFNIFDYAQAQPATRLVTDILMFIGAGSASTAGGIKVTTFLILWYAILAEARGDDTVDAFGRRISTAVLRQAVAVVLLTIAFIVAGTMVLLLIGGFSLDQTLFEVISAVGTVGLSTGVTAGLPASGQAVMIVLMLAGRIGPITLASALALRQRHRLYRLPEERPIVG